MPLVHRAGALSKRSASVSGKARKIKPQYAEGELVKVARAENQRRGGVHRGPAAGGGHPQRAAQLDRRVLAGVGPREVLVPESGAEAAREALAFPAGQPVRPAR